MKIGFNLLLWTTFLSEKDFHIIDKLKNAGYDGIEIPIFSGVIEDYEKISKILIDNELESTSITVIPDEEHNPISPDIDIRNNAIDYLKWAIDCCEVLNSKILCGPFHQPLGVFSGSPPSEDEKKRGIEVHQKISDYAKKYNINLSIEPLNRFECYFLNTVDDTKKYVNSVNRDNFGMLYDTFHSNIEEKSPINSILNAKKTINHVHISENDRGIPGKGHIQWEETFNSLKKINYDGWVTIEAFSRSLPDLAAATKVWRDFFTTKEQVYKEGYEFKKKLI